MDLEDIFLSHFAIAKKPDIFQLIGAAIQIGAWKHPAKFKKRKDGILKQLMDPGKRPRDVEVIDGGVDEIELEDEVIDSEVDESELEDEVIYGGIDEIEKDEVTGTAIENDEVINNAGTEIEEGEIIDGGTDDVEALAVEIEELVQAKDCRSGEDQETHHQEKGNISNIMSTVEQGSKNLVSDKENKTQGGQCRIITSAMESAATNKFTKRMSNMKQLHKQSNTNAFKRQGQTTKERLRKKLGFKKMETDFVRHKHLNCDGDRVKKTEGTQQTPVQSNNHNATDRKKGSATKQCSAQGSKKLSSMTKMNVAIKRVEVAPPYGNQLLSDCSKHKKLEEGEQQLQKQKSSNRDLKERWPAKFDSSKRKYCERVEEISKAKRRAIMVDFDDMQKPPKDQSAPKRCWDRRRF